LIGTFVIVCYVRPFYNWDMLAYVALARDDGSADFVEVHRNLYADLATVVSAEQYNILTGILPGKGSLPREAKDRKYMAEVARDAAAFREQLPFYSVKPVYPMLISLLGFLSIDHFHASVIVTLTAYVLVCALVWHWLRRYHASKVTAAFAALVVLTSPLATLARTSSPDLLSVWVIALSTYLLLEHRVIAWAIALMLLSIPIRPNNAVWVVVMTGYLAVWAPTTIRINRWVAAGVAGAAVAVYVALTQLAEFYGLSTLFYVATVEYLPRPATFVSPLGPLDYARVYIEHLWSTARGVAVVFALIAALALTLLRRAGDLRNSAFAHIVLIRLATPIPLWLVNPPIFDRLAAVQYLIVVVIAIIAAGSRQHATLAPVPAGVGRGRGEA